MKEHVIDKEGKYTVNNSSDYLTNFEIHVYKRREGSGWNIRFTYPDSEGFECETISWNPPPVIQDILNRLITLYIRPTL